MFDPVTYQNNPFANDLMLNAVGASKQPLYEMVATLRKQYWEAHAALSTTSFDTKKDQTVAMRKLGQLAELIAALEEAHSRAARLGCWLQGE